MVLPPQGPPTSGAPHLGGRPLEQDWGASPGGGPRRSLDGGPSRSTEFAGVTLLLILLNGTVMGLMIAHGVGAFAPSAADVLAWGANFGPLTLRGQWWRLVTSTFVHGGLVHLGFNMVVLWDLGRLTERAFGSLGFALVYLVAGIGGSFTSVMLSPFVPSVGASGAVFGVAGAFLAFLLRNRRQMHPGIGRRLRRSLVTFVLMNLAIGLAVPGIDQAAHVGGLAIGFLAGLVIAPRIGREGLSRPGARYPLVAALGAAMLALAWLGVSPPLP